VTVANAIVRVSVTAIALTAVVVVALAPQRAAHATEWATRASVRDTVRTSMDGVYTAAQATAGSDVFANYCRSCHTPTFHTGPTFRAKWFGKPLSDLFGYLRREMPKSDPGSMSDEEYAQALAYLLRMNGMPAGARPLAPDSAALHRIRLDSVRTTSTTQPQSR
jgi:mono/diheme cytochrome c family protein